MWCYNTKGEHIVIQRHPIIIIMKFIKTFIFLVFALLLYYFAIKFNGVLDNNEWLKIVIFVLSFILINYSFLKFITYIIIYFNNVIVLYWDQFVIIKSSLIMRDDIESIDIYKIIKVDSFSRWFFSNILWYWTFVIEQQKTEVRNFDYISNPHRLLRLFEQQREKYRTKKYVNIKE